MSSNHSRTGRSRQRYDDDNGRRLIAGTIPFRFIRGEKVTETERDETGRKERTMTTMAEGIDNADNSEIEVLVISCRRKPNKRSFPKGGWELDETAEEAARRETLEEAGVSSAYALTPIPIVHYKSKSSPIGCTAHFFLMCVTEQLEKWPEDSVRMREWVSVEQAQDVLKDTWMKDILYEAVSRGVFFS